jgi:DNA adenine methylase
MKIKPLVKVNKFYLTSWIIEHFPKDYEEMSYVEPFIGGGSVFLNKNTSKEETINDDDFQTIQLWRVLRDEGKSFLSKLKKIDCNEKTFKSYQNKITKNYFDESLKEFILMKMSQNEQKKKYLANNSKKWKETLLNLEEIIKKLKNTNIFNKNPIEIIKYFNSENSFIYCNPPILDILAKKSEKMSTDQHIELSVTLNSCQGKVMISGQYNSLYKKLYSDWKLCKNKRKKECIWINF